MVLPGKIDFSDTIISPNADLSGLFEDITIDDSTEIKLHQKNSKAVYDKIKYGYDYIDHFIDHVVLVDTPRITINNSLLGNLRPPCTN